MNTKDSVSVDQLAVNDTSGVMKLAALILGLGFGGFLLFAALVPLDEGVPTLGNVVLDTKRRPVQHLQGGVVKEVYIREGQIVKIGQLLLRLNDSIVRAEFENARQSVAGLKVQERGRREQISLLNRELSSVRELVLRDYFPLTKQLELERQLSQLETSLGETINSIAAASERFNSAKETLEKTEIRAVDAGQIVGLSVQSSGAVIQPGQKLMEIVPEKESLILETKIYPHLIDRIAVGDIADIRFSAFSHSPIIVVEGRLTSLSQDSLFDETTRQSFYLARIEVTTEGLTQLGSRKMQPGMPVEVIIKTGSRTLLKYIVDPLLRRVALSLKEE
jgi:protease secretion system membrane fusion protein